MGQFEVIYNVNIEFVQYLDDITVDEININLLSVRESDFLQVMNEPHITGLQYDCNGCNESIMADITTLVPTNITQCDCCGEVVCNKCMLKNEVNDNVCPDCSEIK
tara:strand:+ start:452 stop:769 length:318 start_codon:yes stop_codon:yes gene_type:complete